MTELLEFFWPVHRAGYALASGAELGRKTPADALLGKSAGADHWLVPVDKTPPSASDAYAKVIDFRDPLKLGLCVYRNFVDWNATPEGALRFTDSYGFLFEHDYSKPQGMLLDTWLSHQKNMRSAILAWERKSDVSKMVFDFNAVDLGPLKTKLRQNRSGKGVYVVLQPKSLWAMMWVEFALQISNQSGIRQCEWCSNWFPYGTGTGRRSKARFCSDPCRKTSHMQSKKEDA